MSSIPSDNDNLTATQWARRVEHVRRKNGRPNTDAKLVLMTLAEHADHDTGRNASPSNLLLTQETGVTNVEAILDALVAHGLIEPQTNDRTGTQGWRVCIEVPVRTFDRATLKAIKVEAVQSRKDKDAERKRRQRARERSNPSPNPSRHSREPLAKGSSHADVPVTFGHSHADVPVTSRPPQRDIPSVASGNGAHQPRTGPTKGSSDQPGVPTSSAVPMRPHLAAWQWADKPIQSRSHREKADPVKIAQREAWARYADELRDARKDVGKPFYQLDDEIILWTEQDAQQHAIKRAIDWRVDTDKCATKIEDMVTSGQHPKAIINAVLRQEWNNW